jgi:3,4-dihydroxy 2-butanone 4-phosphate synthase/GTP cyclohydrolase II
MSLSPITDIIADMKAGRLAVLVDEEDRENEGDLIFAADFVTPEKINFMAVHGRGLVCMPITAEHAARLNLAPMVLQNRSVHGTNFTVSIEAAHGVTTGISAADRAHTIRVAAAADAKASDIVQPGHVFPLIAQPGGVLARAGHTEACCDLAALAGLTPCAVLCEIMNADGTMARLPDLARFAAEHGLKIGAISDLIQYRSRTERLIERIAERPLATVHGAFRLCVYRDKLSDATHLALVRGPSLRHRDARPRARPLSVMDLLDAGHTSHSWSIAAALAAIARAGRGVVRFAAPSRERAGAAAPRARRRGTGGLEGRSSQLRDRRPDSARSQCRQDATPREDRARCRAWPASISRSRLRRAAGGAASIVAFFPAPALLRMRQP